MVRPAGADRPSDPRGAPIATADIVYPLAGKRVYVAGHRGMFGSAIVRRIGDRRDHCQLDPPRGRLRVTGVLRHDQAGRLTT